MARLASCELRYGGPAGPLATISRETRPAPQRTDPQAFAQSLVDIRLELAMRSGSIPADMGKALKEQDSVLSYHTS